MCFWHHTDFANHIVRYEQHHAIKISHVFAVPIDRTQGIQMLYVFVDIKIDTFHFIETLRFNFEHGSHLALVSTIQFVAALQVRGSQNAK